MTVPSTATNAPASKPALTPASWLALAFIAVFSYLDWITHRELATTIVLAVIAGVVVVYRQALIDRLNLREAVASIPARVKPILAAIPGVGYFLIRGQGTSNAGSVVFVSMLVVVGISVAFGPQLDRSLAGFYRTRNRFLPRLVRMTLAIILPVLVAFLVVHGSLADLPALFGGKTNHPSTPVGLESRFFIATLLSAAIAWALLREAPATAATQPSVPATSWTPTHTTPEGGLSAWDAPTGSAASTHVDGNLPVQVAERNGDWARVVAANGWTGWVDARLLVERGGH